MAILNREEMENILVDYVRRKRGCTKENIIKDESIFISRGTVYKIVKDLEIRKIVEVRQERPNSRNHELYVIDENPIVTAQIELAELEKNVDIFLQKIKKPEMKYKVSSDEKNARQLYYLIPLGIIGSVIQAYLIKLFHRWSEYRQDVLAELISKVFVKIAQIIMSFGRNIKVKKYLEPDYSDLAEYGYKFVFQIVGALIACDKYGVLAEFSEILDSIWKINSDIEEFIFLEPKNDNLNYKYGIDSWKKLVKEWINSNSRTKKAVDIKYASQVVTKLLN